jgi:cytoskeletal protein CcmA (bactofilin family)
MIELRPVPGKQIESELSLFSQGSLIKGGVTFDQVARLHGRIEGKVFGLEGSVIIVGETASVHGEIIGDEIIIDGFVHGNVEGKSKVTISEYGRLIGDVRSPKFEIRFGAHFDGKAITTTARSSVGKGNT